MPLVTRCDELAERMSIELHTIAAMHIDHLTKRETAVEYLAGKLREGTLVLVLGAGTSTTSGLPAWHELISAMGKRVGRVPRVNARSSAEQLQASADKIRREHFDRDEPGFARLVSECLYPKRLMPKALLKDQLLLALGALITGSRRGSVRRVITLNFDCVLEWYLTLHGVIPNVVHSLPYLEGIEDVRIFHPHGFLPHSKASTDQSNFVILGVDSINKRLGTTGDPWMDVMRHTLRTGVCLFVGLSMRSFGDRAIAPLLNAIGAELKDRPTGFWLFPQTRGVDKKRILNQNIVPVCLEGTKVYPEFLLSVCRDAAQQVQGLQKVS